MQVSEESDAVVFVATPAMSSHTIINTGNPETLVSAAAMAQAIKSERGCSYPTSMMCLLPPLPSPKVCVTTSGAVSVHSWLAHHATYSKSRPFIFNKDPNSYNDRFVYCPV